MNMRYTIITTIIILILVNNLIASQNLSKKDYHTNKAVGELPNTYNDLFGGSGACLLCHNEQVNLEGSSVSIISDWRSTMMANAARDPFWRAKVSHEGLVNPSHKEELENICTRCHAPTGNENAHFLGQTYYSINEMVNDPLALDGVQCTVCHQITEESMGNYSGTFEIGIDHIIWGPYEDPFANPMVFETGYTPTQGNQIMDSRLCASCHTLITNSVDNSGNPTGNQFVEQAIYHEWLNSDYSINNESCQSCHVPRIDDPVSISTRPPWLEPRSPFGMHHFTGANTFMVKMIKENGEELGVNANDAQFDSTIVRNTRMLRNKSILAELIVNNRTLDSLYLELSLTNIVGHKFPSGYPSRRVTIELIVSNNNDTIFHSGEFDIDGNLLSEDSDMEPHYNMINLEEQVQIYELVMGDINNEVTTVLERANYPLKDNRIPPLGFSSNHFAYDTVSIAGMANDDPNFNYSNGIEGSGSDVLFFNIPTTNITDNLDISVNIYYQTVNPKWLSHMFTYSSEEIDLFKSYFDGADKSPFLVKAIETTSSYTDIKNNINKSFKVYPNPATDRIIIKSDERIESVEIFGLGGNKLIIDIDFKDSQAVVNTSNLHGIYIISFKTKSSKRIQKVVIK